MVHITEYQTVKSYIHYSSKTSRNVGSLETVGLAGRQEADLKGKEQRMRRLAIEVTKMKRIINKYDSKTAGAERIGVKLIESGLRWYRHVLKRDEDHVKMRVIKMELPGRKENGAKEGSWTR